MGDVNFIFHLLNITRTQRQFFNRFHCETRCALRCAVLYSVLNFVVQFYLRARGNKFHIATCWKYVAKYTILIYVHFQIFAFTCIYFLPCSFKTQ